MTTVIVPTRVRQLTIRQDGDRVLIIERGVLLFDLPWDAALELSRALRVKAKLAEEEAKANAIVADQAVLFNHGVPILLSARTDIVTEALRSAGGIKSQAVLGKPRIIQEKSRRDQT